MSRTPVLDHLTFHLAPDRPYFDHIKSEAKSPSEAIAESFRSLTNKIG